MFKNHISYFNENLIGLRDFVDLIDPFLTDKLNEHNEHISPLVTLGVLKDLLSRKKDWEENEKEKLLELKDKINEDIIKIYNKEIDVEIETEEVEGDEKRRITKFHTSNNVEIRQHLDDSKKTRSHIELLYRNSLISLLSSVEWFFSQILHHYYNEYPNSTGIQKKTMSLSELKSFGTIEDAEKYLIDVKIEEILRGSFDSWISVLKEELKLKMSYLEPIIDELVEIYQRRNLFVHNGGVVNSIYLSKVNEDLRPNLKLNDKLDVSKEYLDNAICKLQKAFILIASELWKNLDKKDTTRGDLLTEIVYENLLKLRWDISEGLTYFILHDSQLDSIVKIIAQLNFWLCKKRTNQFESIRIEVEKEDYSDKKEIYQLGLYALKEDKKSFFKALPIALDSKQLTLEKLEEFPIFKEMRETNEYIEFKDKSKYFKKPVEKSKGISKKDSKNKIIEDPNKKKPKKAATNSRLA